MHYSFNVKKGFPSQTRLSNQRQGSETKYLAHFASSPFHFVSHHQNDPLTRICLRQIPMKSVNLPFMYLCLSSEVEKTNSDQIPSFRLPPGSACRMRVSASPHLRWLSERLQAIKPRAVAVETSAVLSTAARLKKSSVLTLRF